MTDRACMKKTLLAFQGLTLLLSLNAVADPAFMSAQYNKVSDKELQEGEQTAFYEYPNNPCGTLMTQFTEPGSVRLGRGPAYAIALKKCQEKNPDATPNDFTVRVYSCKNSLKDGVIRGGATFAFQCGDGYYHEECTPEQKRGQDPSKKWNCHGIDKKKRT